MLVDKDENGTLVWAQHHLVMSRTIMSPTGVIIEKQMHSCKCFKVSLLDFVSTENFF